MQEEPAVPLRIGVHTGDIVFTEDDIIGDGVNVGPVWAWNRFTMIPGFWNF